MAGICRPRLALAAAQAARARLAAPAVSATQSAVTELVNPLQKPRWAAACEERHFPMLHKLQPCFPIYREVLGAMDKADFKPAGMIVNSEAQAKLGEFFLCCACALRLKEVEHAGTDNTALLRVAQATAEEDFEPWLQEVQDFIADFDSDLADKLEAAAALRTSDEGRFWEASFAAAAPDDFDALVIAAEQAGDAGLPSESAAAPSTSSQSFSSSPSSPSPLAASSEGHVEAAGSSGDGEREEASAAACSESVSASPARHQGEVSNEPTAFEKAVVAQNEGLVFQMYEKWLEAAAQPLKRELRDSLSDVGLIVAKEVLEEAARNKLD
ncbi:hypothetical protein BESB_061920 [Besnoitia besnoiti]|uniref:Uncharacterized protein n=1 Tax=Besnoitia besnoiti TaxID=94643 RepID=A0A2A9MBG0_BESBE|nr:hypothetical protein BESB_061920 [Besnoitia besnoiti]PFH35305.1 hypothetical protein BESB_061920 [Besnoitia besnoiti]